MTEHTTDQAPDTAHIEDVTEAILREGRENPLSPAQRRRLLERIVRRVREGAMRRGDTATVEALDTRCRKTPPANE